MPPINFNKLLQNSNNNNSQASSASSNNSFARNLEKTVNYAVKNSFHPDDKLINKSVQVTHPSLILFNAMVNKDFPRADRKLELGMLAEDIVKTKLPLRKYVYPNNGIAVQVKKITGRYGRLQPAFTITDAYSHTGTNIFNSRVFVLEFLVAVSLGNETVNSTVSIFSNGKMKVSGGYLNKNNDNMNNEEYFEAQPELIREYIVDNYTNKEKFLRNDFTFNNVVSEVRFNKGFNLSVIASIENRARYEPERSPNLFFKYEGFDYVVSRKGIVKIQGITEYDDIQESFEHVLDFVNNCINFEKSQPAGRIRRILLELNSNGTRSKKQSRFNPNLPAPNVTRRGTSCPTSRCPNPYSMQGKCPQDGYYVKPNPQGQPCCYKIPKSVSYSEKKVMNAYARANVKVPNAVRNAFKFGNNTNAKRNNTSHAKLNNIVVKMNSKVGLKIGSRQCSRYSKVALVDIAHRLGLPVAASATKESLCELIKTVAKNVTNTNNAGGSRAVKISNGEKVLVVTGNSVNTLKIGGRIAKTIKHEKLFNYAVKIGARPPSAATIASLCKLIYEKYMAMRPNTPASSRSSSPSPSPSPSPQPNNRGAAMAEFVKKFRLNKNLIAEDIKKFLGNAWISKTGTTNNSISRKAENVYAQLTSALNGNRLRLNAKEIKEFKKTLLKKWKENTELNVKKTKYAGMNKAVINYATTRNTTGKFPSHANVVRYANVRAGLMRPNVRQFAKVEREEI